MAEDLIHGFQKDLDLMFRGEPAGAYPDGAGGIGADGAMGSGGAMKAGSHFDTKFMVQGKSDHRGVFSFHGEGYYSAPLLFGRRSIEGNALNFRKSCQKLADEGQFLFSDSLDPGAEDEFNPCLETCDAGGVQGAAFEAGRHFFRLLFPA